MFGPARQLYKHVSMINVTVDIIEIILAIASKFSIIVETFEIGS